MRRWFLVIIFQSTARVANLFRKKKRSEAVPLHKAAKSGLDGEGVNAKAVSRYFLWYPLRKPFRNPLFVFEDWLLNRIGYLGASLVGCLVGSALGLFFWRAICSLLMLKPY